MGTNGVHVLGPSGSEVTTLTALTGRVIGKPHQQGTSGADSKLWAVDVLLDNGNVAIYVDLVTVSVHAGQYLRAGAKVGTIGGGSGKAAGLHFTLLRGGRAEDAHFRNLTSRAAQGDYTASRDIKVEMFINPLGPESPVNCPGVAVDNGSVKPYP